jgi:2'-5' RNA ligase
MPSTVSPTPSADQTITVADPPTGIAIPMRIPPPLAAIRRRWDEAALAGARSHVTVLYPFVPVAHLVAADRATLAGIARAVEPFDVRFERVRRIDDGVVWVEPEPAEPFRRLTAAVHARWPDYPPYEGRFDEVIPHLTIVESDVVSLAPIEVAALASVPFIARASRMELWRQDDAGRWHPHWLMRLGRRNAD